MLTSSKLLQNGTSVLEAGRVGLLLCGAAVAV